MKKLTAWERFEAIFVIIGIIIIGVILSKYIISANVFGNSFKNCLAVFLIGYVAKSIITFVKR